MGAVGDVLDPSAAVPMTIGAVNATSVSFGSQQNTLPVNMPLQRLPFVQGTTNLTETVASASAVALSSTKLVHLITGTTTISTFTGGVEGQYAICLFSGALTLTNSGSDTVNSIHNNSKATGSAPANFTTTGASAASPYIKEYLCTANMPGFTALQWFEL